MFIADHALEQRVALYAVAAYAVVTISSFFYRYFIRGGKNLKKAYGSYAIVTGATDGIGKAIAFELARKQLNLILISRTESKLLEVAAEIKAKYSNVHVETIAVDFGHITAANTAAIAAAVTTHDVGVLVNNVGLSYNYPDWFHNLSSSDVTALTALNISSTTAMTHAVLPAMVERKRGCIVNLSSAASLSPAPLLAQYGAAKAFVDKFSHALNTEYSQYNIHVQTQNPLYVATKMAKVRPSLQAPTPAAFARAAVAAFGYETQLSPYWLHAIMIGALTRMPAFISNSYVLGLHKSIRIRAMKKAGITSKAK